MAPCGPCGERSRSHSSRGKKILLKSIFPQKTPTKPRSSLVLLLSLYAHSKTSCVISMQENPSSSRPMLHLLRLHTNLKKKFHSPTSADRRARSADLKLLQRG